MNIALSDAAILVLTSALVVCSPLLPLLMQPPPKAGDIALVLAAPWGDAAGIAAQAEVQEVAPERSPLGVLVSVTDPQSVDRLYAHGAWLVVDGKRVLELCSI